MPNTEGYEQGIEKAKAEFRRCVAEDAEMSQIPGRLVEAFLSAQPTAWFCEVHECSAWEEAEYCYQGADVDGGRPTVLGCRRISEVRIVERETP